MKKYRRICAFLGALIFFSTALFSSCGSEVEIKSVSWYEYFDTVITLYAADTDTAEFEKLSAEVELLVRKYHEMFDIYGDGDIAKINENAGKSAASVSSETIELIEFSIEMHALTDGKCNIALGSVLKIWHTYRENALLGLVSVPTADELEDAGEHTDINNIKIDKEAGTVFLSDPEMSIDLGAVAKGFAADRCREYLISVGAKNAAVSFGGNIAAAGGKTDTEPWLVGVEDPMGGENVTTLEIFGNAVATSGSYQRYYEADGVRLHHIIDPDTLFPRNELLSVTVTAPSAALADAISTAVFNMPLDVGKAFLDSLDGVFAVWVTSDGDTVFSK